MISTSNTITHEWWIPKIISINEKNSRQHVVEEVIVYLKSSTGDFTYTDPANNSQITENLTKMSQLSFKLSNGDLTEFTERSNLSEEQVLGWCGVTSSSITGNANTLMSDHETELLVKKDELEDPRDYTLPPWDDPSKE